MAYNYSLHTKQLARVDLQRIKRAIALAYSGGITSAAQLGSCGDDIILFGEILTKHNSYKGRKSLVSIRMYNSDVELLVTDIKGNFLFYGRYDINIGLEKVAKKYEEIIDTLFTKIRKNVADVSASFKNVEFSSTSNLDEAFELMVHHQNFALKQAKLYPDLVEKFL